MTRWRYFAAHPFHRDGMKKWKDWENTRYQAVVA
jgi:hypothetical protein